MSHTDRLNFYIATVQELGGGSFVKVCPQIVRLFFVLSLFFCCASLHANTVYVSQNGGNVSGGSACNGQPAISAAKFNGTTLSPGDTVYFCGTISSPISINQSGSSGNPITLKWDTGAKLSYPFCGGGPCLNLGGQSWLVLDGGSPCGPGTSCTSTDTGTGILEETDNGTGLAHQSCTDQAISMFGSNNEIKNLIVRNVYKHTSTSDNTCGAGDAQGIMTGQTSNNNIHDSTFHDVCTPYRGNGGPVININFHHNNLYNYNWGFQQGTGNPQVQQNLLVHDNHFGSPANWDDTVTNHFHHNGVFLYNNSAHDGSFNGVYIYNNLFDGDAGCCSTGRIFFGGGQQQNTYIFNNVVVETGTGTSNGPLTLAAEETGSLFIYNNTIIGAGINNQQQTINAIEGHSTVENNVFTNLSAMVNIQGSVYGGAAPTPVLYDYNAYGIGGNGTSGTGSNWQAPFGSSTTLTSWRSSLLTHGVGGAEAHSIWISSGSMPGLSLSSTGVPQSSLVINVGANLSSLCAGNLAPLCSDTSVGGTRTPTPRPSTGPWTIGAYNAGTGTPPTRPAPPTNLGATIN
jgi:hypothetical protein